VAAGCRSLTGGNLRHADGRLAAAR